MSKEENNIIKINKKTLNISDNIENVPYLNNNSDSIQDILKEVEDNTLSLESNLISNNNENVININFLKQKIKK